MGSNPNATVAGGTAGIGVFVVWLLGYFGVDISAEMGGLIAGGVATVALWVGRRGIRGAFSELWNGSPPPPES